MKPRRSQTLISFDRSYRGHSHRDSLRDNSLGETSYTFLLRTPGPWENVKMILLVILLGTGP